MSDLADFLFRRLRLRHIHLLVILGELGSVRATAQRMSLSQPAVSKMLNEVEAAFGERLFERDRRGVMPNAYGRTAMRRARIVLSELEGAAEEVQSLRGGGGLLRLGTLSIMDFVPRAVAGLLSRVPGCRIQIREGRVQELVKLLLDGELDCMVGSLSPAAIEAGPIEEMQAEMVLEDRLCVLMSARHELAGAATLSWRELATQRWVMPPKSTVVRQAVVNAFTGLGLPLPAPVVEVLSPVTLRAVLAADSRLIGVVRLEDEAQAHADGLRLLEVAPRIALPPLCLYTRRNAGEPPTVVQVFAQELQRAAAARTTPARGTGA